MTDVSLATRLRHGLALCVLPPLLAACGSSGETAAEATAEATDAALEDAGDETYVVDESTADDTSTVDVVDVPAATSSSDSTLSDAARIARLIAAGDGIRRVRHGDGWAWMQGDRIIRTASDDGREVAYFRDGSDTPFFVQDDDRSYAYNKGTVTRAYDKRGAAKKIEARERDEAGELVRDAREDRDRAERVVSDKGGRGDAPSRTEDRPTQQQTTPQRTEPARSRDDDRPSQRPTTRPADNTASAPGSDRRSDRPRPTATATRSVGPNEHGSAPN